MLNFTNQEFMAFTGQFGLWVLLAILVISPILYIRYKPIQKKRAILTKIRRWLGWLFGTITVSHLVFYVLVYSTSLDIFLNTFTEWWGILGWLTIIITVVLTLTSNNKAVKIMKRKWKLVHKLTYILPVLAIAHGALALKGVPIEAFYLWIYYFVIILALRVKISRGWFSVVLVGSLIITSLYYYTADSDYDIIVPEGVPVIKLSDIDTSHPNYEEIWWNKLRGSRLNIPPKINYSPGAIAFCAQTGAEPYSIGETVLYCSDGTRR